MNDTVFTQPHQPKEVRVELDAQTAAMLEAAMEDVALAVSSFHAKRGSDQRIVKLILDGNQRDEFEQRYANLRAHYSLPDYLMQPLDMRDWVAHVQQHIKPIRAGRYYIHGSHVERVPLGATCIALDAGAAFGTGEHETTMGCLVAIDQLLRARRVSRALDMGCGTAVLAIAAAKSQPIGVDASDIDPVSVRVARDNARRNHAKIGFSCGPGYRAKSVRGQYDLIIANILARPLMGMVRDARRHLAPGGVLVLSGLLNRQEQMVLFAHRQVGLQLVRRIRIGPWSTLVLKG